MVELVQSKAGFPLLRMYRMKTRAGWRVWWRISPERMVPAHSISMFKMIVTAASDTSTSPQRVSLLSASRSLPMWPKTRTRPRSSSPSSPTAMIRNSSIGEWQHFSSFLHSFIDRRSHGDIHKCNSEDFYCNQSESNVVIKTAAVNRIKTLIWILTAVLLTVLEWYS